MYRRHVSVGKSLRDGEHDYNEEALGFMDFLGLISDSSAIHRYPFS
jgi:hypothetical protein